MTKQTDSKTTDMTKAEIDAWATEELAKCDLEQALSNYDRRSDERIAEEIAADPFHTGAAACAEFGGFPVDRRAELGEAQPMSNADVAAARTRIECSLYGRPSGLMRFFA